MRNANGLSWATAACGLALLANAGGCATNGSQEPREVQKRKQEHVQQLEELEARRQVTLEKIRQMQLPELVDQMDRDAERSREPFNSVAYRELTKRRQEQGPALRQEILRRQTPSYITLLSLRKVDREGYLDLPKEMKLNPLIAELGRSRSYNVWGIPHLYWDEAAQAIIELGRAAEPGLKKYLRDQSPAPVWGSEERREYEAYQYRRCDYALGMIMAIRGQDVRRLPKSPAERDDLIGQILGE